MSGQVYYSLSGRLLRLLVPSLLAGFFLVAALSVFSIGHEIDEVYDASLAQSAKIILRLSEHEIEEHRKSGIALTANKDEMISHKYEKNLSFRVWYDNTPFAQSSSAGSFGGIVPPPGFSDQVVDGHIWRFFVYVDDVSKITVETAEKYHIRDELMYQLLASMGFPALFFAALVILIVWKGVQYGLKPLVALSSAVDSRDARDLHPVVGLPAPREAKALLLALNRLLERMRLSLQRERDLTDNAAHELRTPLAAMKTQAQVLMRREGLARHEKEGFDNLLASIDRSGRMVEQMLALSRLQAEETPLSMLDISVIVGEVIADMSAVAKDKGLHLDVSVNGGLKMAGNESALYLMVRNILDNAFKFSPKDGRVEIFLGMEGEKVVFSVKDQGPGIPAGEKEKVFERFQRLNKSVPGSGLGLAIVRWTADMHRAEIRLEDNRPQGLVFKVVFPGKIF